MEGKNDRHIDECASALNGIFARAGVRFLTAIPAVFEAAEALRVTYRTALADPQADLDGADRRKLASAFLKAGFAAGEYKALLDRANKPALYMECFTPPTDLYWTTRYKTPWTVHVLRPDHGFMVAQADALVDALRLRFA